MTTRLVCAVIGVTALLGCAAQAANSVQYSKDFPAVAASNGKTNIEAKGTVTVDAGWTCISVASKVTVMRMGAPVVVGAEDTNTVMNNAWGKWTFGEYANDTYLLVTTALRTGHVEDHAQADNERRFAV
jgi:hypothetical protein